MIKGDDFVSDFYTPIEFKFMYCGDDDYLGCTNCLYNDDPLCDICSRNIDKSLYPVCDE